MGFSFFFADLADVHKLLHERLIFRSQPDLIAAHHVSATVAHLHEIEFAVLDGRARQRRAHAAATTVFQTLEVNRAVGLQGRVLQTIDER